MRFANNRCPVSVANHVHRIAHMAKEPEKVVIHDRQLVCHHCGGQRFFHRTVAMSGAGASFFGLEWFTQGGAFCYTCSDCGHVHWFLPEV
jgi:hypothetical protein